MDHADAPHQDGHACARGRVRRRGHPLRHHHGGRPTVLRRAPRRGAGPARAERRRQDQHRRGARGLPAGDLGHRAGARAGPGSGPCGAGAPDRRDAAEGWRLPDARAHPGAPTLRRLLRRPRGPGRPAGPGRADPRRADALAPAVRGRAAAPLPRPGPRRPTRGPLPRRADRRRRPRGSHRGPGPHRRPAGQGAVRPAHHPRTGRGRAPGRPGRHRRPGPATGRGVTRRAGLGHGGRVGPLLHRPRHRYGRPGRRRRPGRLGRPRSARVPTASACPPEPTRRRSSPHSPAGWPSATSRSATCAPGSRWRRPTWPSPGPGPIPAADAEPTGGRRRRSRGRAGRGTR